MENKGNAGTPGVDTSTKLSSSLEDKIVSPHKPIPRPKPRKPSEVSVQSPSPIEHATPTNPSKPKPVPRMRTVTTSKPPAPTKAEEEVRLDMKAVDDAAAGRELAEEEQKRESPISNDNDAIPIVTVMYKPASPPPGGVEVEPKPSVGDGDGGKELGVTVRQISYQNVTINIKDSGAVTLSAPLPKAAGPKEPCQESQTCPTPATQELLTANSPPEGSIEELSQDDSPPKGSSVEPSQEESPPKGNSEEPSQDDCDHKKYGSDSNINITSPITTPTSKQEDMAESVGNTVSSSPKDNGQENKLVYNQLPEQAKSVSSSAEEDEEHYVEVDEPGIQARPPSPDTGTYDIPRPSCSPTPQLSSSPIPEDNSYDIPRPLNREKLLREQQQPAAVGCDVPKLSGSLPVSAQTERETISSPDYDLPTSVLTPLSPSSSSLSQVMPGRRENGVAAEQDGEHQYRASVSSTVSTVSQYGPSPQRDAWGVSQLAWLGRAWQKGRHFL